MSEEVRFIVVCVVGALLLALSKAVDDDGMGFVDSLFYGVGVFVVMVVLLRVLFGDWRFW